MRVAIYALCEYPSWEPRYIGKTANHLSDRHKSHIRAAKRGRHLPVHHWLRKQIEAGKRLAIRLIEYAGDDWAEREKYWIKFHRPTGRLLNLTDGGEGLSGHVFSDEHKEKIAAGLRTGSHFNCETCGSEFWRKRKDIAKGDCRFCSRPCYAESQRGVSRPVPTACKERGVAAAAAMKRARSECKRGHPLAGDNLFINSAGSRGCKECRRLHKAAYIARRAANG